MRTLAFAWICLLLVSLALSYQEEADADSSDAYDDDQGRSLLDVFSNAKRSNKFFLKWCARWGDYCKPDTRLKYAQCCPGLDCKCGLIWTSSKCTCKGKFLGRR